MVNRGDFEDLRRQHPEVDRLLIGVLAQMVDRLTRQVAELTEIPGTVRIYRRIVALAELYGGDGEVATSDPVEIPLTQDQLASLAGVHLRLTSRVLGEARAAGLLDTNKGRLVDQGPARPAQPGPAPGLTASAPRSAERGGDGIGDDAGEPAAALGARCTPSGASTGSVAATAAQSATRSCGRSASSSASTASKAAASAGRSARWTLTHTTGASGPTASSTAMIQNA